MQCQAVWGRFCYTLSVSYSMNSVVLVDENTKRLQKCTRKGELLFLFRSHHAVFLVSQSRNISLPCADVSTQFQVNTR